MSSLSNQEYLFVNRVPVTKLAWYAYQAGGLASIRYSCNHKTGGTEFKTSFTTHNGAERYYNTMTQRFNIAPKVESGDGPYGSIYTITVPAPDTGGPLPHDTYFPYPVTGGAKGLKKLLGQSSLGAIAPRKWRQ